MAGSIGRYRAGEIDAYAADETIHHYHHAAAELWKFCFLQAGPGNRHASRKTRPSGDGPGRIDA